MKILYDLSIVYSNILFAFLLRIIAITVNKTMHVTITISPTTTPAIGPTSLGVAILSLKEDEINGVIPTVSKHSRKCNNSK